MHQKLDEEYFTYVARCRIHRKEYIETHRMGITGNDTYESDAAFAEMGLVLLDEVRRLRAANAALTQKLLTASKPSGKRKE